MAPEGEGAPAHRADSTASESPQAREVRQVRPGLYSVLAGGRSYEVVVDVEVGEDVTGVADVDGQRVQVSIESPRRRALAAVIVGSGGRSAGPVTVVAPMPGRVIAVPVAPGAAVERGQTVLVLEAMKMESAIAAPHAGKVSEVLVSPGQPVQQRQPLLRIEPSGPATG